MCPDGSKERSVKSDGSEKRVEFHQTFQGREEKETVFALKGDDHTVTSAQSTPPKTRRERCYSMQRQQNQDLAKHPYLTPNITWCLGWR